MTEATDLQRLVISLEANLKKYEKEMARANGIAQDSTRRVARDFDRMNGNISTGFSKLAVAAAGAFSVAALVAFSKKAIEVADEIAEAAERAGVTAESFQELSYAAKLAGVSSESLEKALMQLSRRAGGAAEEADEVSDALNKLGIATADIRGMKPDALFKLIADRIAGLKNPMQEATIAYALFGREGQRFLPTLRGGAAELARLAAEARKMGFILSDETLKSAAKAADEFDRVGLAFRAAGVNISIGMLPALEQLRKMLTDPAAQDGAKRLGAAIGEATLWLVNNKDTIILVASTLAGMWTGRMLGPAGAAAGGAAGFAAGLEILEKLKAKTTETTSEIEKLRKKQAELDQQMKTGDYGEAELNNLLEQYNKLGAEIEKLKSGAASAGGAISGVAAQIAQAMKEAGFQTQAIAAALAAAKRESGFNPEAFNPDDAGMPAGGLFQWRGDRLEALKEFAAAAKTTWTDLRAQLAFLVTEFENGEKKAGAMLRAAGDPETAARAFALFERFKGWNQEGNKELQTRIALTKQYHDMLVRGASLPAGPQQPTDRTVIDVPKLPFVDERLNQLLADAAIKARIARGEFGLFTDEFVEAAMKLPRTREQLLLVKGDLEKLPQVIKDAAAGFKDLQRAQDLAKAADDFGKAFGRAFEDAILKAKSFQDVLKALGQELARLMLRLLVTNQLERTLSGAFRSLLGGFGGFGGGPDFIGPPMAPGFAGMGAGPTGMPAPQMAPTAMPAPVAPAARQAGPALQITNNIDARGADAAAVARLERGLDERDRTFARRVGAVMHTRQVRHVRL